MSYVFPLRMKLRNMGDIHTLMTIENSTLYNTHTNMPCTKLLNFLFLTPYKKIQTLSIWYFLDYS